MPFSGEDATSRSHSMGVVTCERLPLKVPGKNSPWWICYWDDQGRKRREKAGAKSTAVKLYQLRKAQVLEGRKLPTRKPPVLFGTLIDDTLVYSREHHSSRWQTEIGYIVIAAREWFGSMTAESITPAQIENFLSEHAKVPATRNRWRSVFSLIFRLGVVNGKILSNPVGSVQRKKENNVRERFLTAEEETRLRVAIREMFPEHEPEFDLALYTGMRASELYNLRWENVDLFRGQLTIPKSKHGEKRHVELNDSAKRALARLQPKSEGPIFGWRWYQKWFSKVCRAAKVANLRWHDLRHTYGSRLTADGIPLRHIMKLMGHRNLNTTLRYSHLAQSDLKAAVLRLDRFAEIGSPSDTRTDTDPSREAAASGAIIQ
jgi:integrase